MGQVPSISANVKDEIAGRDELGKVGAHSGPGKHQESGHEEIPDGNRKQLVNLIDNHTIHRMVSGCGDYNPVTNPVQTRDSTFLNGWPNIQNYVRRVP